MQGGINPDMSPFTYRDVLRRHQGASPGMHVHAFSPMEIMYGARRTGLPSRVLPDRPRRRARLDPGHRRRDPRRRGAWILAQGRCPTATWVEIITTAHRVGMPTTSTVMYGHVETPGTSSGTSTCSAGSRTRPAASPSSCRCRSYTDAPIYRDGVVRPGPKLRDTRRPRGERLMLRGWIDNIQTSWVKLGLDGARATARRLQRLRRHPDGGEHLPDGRLRARLREDHCRAHRIGAGIDRPVRERTTTYGVPVRR